MMRNPAIINRKNDPARSFPCWQSARSMVSKRHYRDSSQTSSSNSFCRLGRWPALVVSLETILESYRLSNQDNLRSSRQVNVRPKQQYITETRPGV